MRLFQVLQFTGARKFFHHLIARKRIQLTGSKEEGQQAVWRARIKRGGRGGKGSLVLSLQLLLPFPSPISTSNTRAVVARNGCS